MEPSRKPLLQKEQILYALQIWGWATLTWAAVTGLHYWEHKSLGSHPIQSFIVESLKLTAIYLVGGNLIDLYRKKVAAK
jgi:hypothetical protein